MAIKTDEEYRERDDPVQRNQEEQLVIGYSEIRHHVREGFRFDECQVIIELAYDAHQDDYEGDVSLGPLFLDESINLFAFIMSFDFFLNLGCQIQSCLRSIIGSVPGC